MKTRYFVFLITSLLAPLAWSEDPLLVGFHEYGITRCDTFIKTTSNLEGSWSFFFSKHAGGLDGSSTEVTMVQIAGKKGDTVKIDYSYIQTAKACFLHARRTVTSEGNCNTKVSGERWGKIGEMSDVDYQVYADGNGMQMYAKDIKVGDSELCIREIGVRARGTHTKN
jgi:hypothetical protein